jgi:hypothetical protein
MTCAVSLALTGRWVLHEVHAGIQAAPLLRCSAVKFYERSGFNTIKIYPAPGGRGGHLMEKRLEA